MSFQISHLSLTLLVFLLVITTGQTERGENKSEENQGQRVNDK
jgi:hypothetical protein